MNELTFLANAKLNLYLDITGKRPDGYHLLETVMQSVDLCDIVTVKLAGEEVDVDCSDPRIPGGAENICFKAAELYSKATGRNFGVKIHIDKRIPHGAGMGGGSADAAAVLTGLNRLFNDALSREELLKLAADIGADVPFCIKGGLKLCKGTGDELYDVKPLPERVYLVVMPDFRCNTKEAYERWDNGPIPPHKRVEEFINSGEKFPEKIYNTFAELYSDKRISDVTGKLRLFGAENAALTGSGAAVFGVFKDEKTASLAAREFPFFFTAVCKPVDSGQLTVAGR